jgi:hypothetical protein
MHNYIGKLGPIYLAEQRSIGRLWGNVWRMRSPIFALAIELSSRNNLFLNRKMYREFSLAHDVEE